MRHLMFHALGIAGAFLAGFAILQWYGGASTLSMSAAETATGVGAMWFALAVLS
jgi:hypothetical protein